MTATLKTVFSTALLICVAVLMLMVTPALLKGLAGLDLILASSPESLTPMELADLEMSEDLPEATDMTEEEIQNSLTNVVIDPAYSHAEEKHGNEALVVRSCFANKGAYAQFQVEKNKRYLRVCIIDEKLGIIGFQIVDIVERIAKERTAYIRQDLKSIGDLFNYIKKWGYPKFTKPL